MTRIVVRARASARGLPRAIVRADTARLRAWWMLWLAVTGWLALWLLAPATVLGQATRREPAGAASSAQGRPAEVSKAVAQVSAQAGARATGQDSLGPVLLNTLRSGRSRSVDTRTIATKKGTRVTGGRGPVQCEKCHADRQFLAGKAKGAKGDSVLFVPDTLLRDSRHQTLVCADCHAGYNDGYPHTKVPQVALTCAHCHEDQGAAYDRSIHAPNFKKEGDAPTCASCHSAHRVLGADDPRSPTYPLNVAQLCGSCHNKKKILEAYFDKPADSTARTAVKDFRKSAHGLAMSKAGLTVSATCSDCHDAHRVLPADSAASTLNRRNVKNTCGACHAGMLATYDSSAHGQALAKGDTTETGNKAPVCVECHGGHKVVEADDPAWFAGVVQECGTCHKRLLETYFETYHGKASTLGYGIAAKCSDCHTAHAMLEAKDPKSSVHKDNLVETCGACHQGANANFVAYKPHGDPRDKDKNPELYWVWLFMTTLLVGVFSFFGIHSLLWFLRLLSVRKERAAGHRAGHAATLAAPAPVAKPAPPVATPPAPPVTPTAATPEAPPATPPATPPAATGGAPSDASTDAPSPKPVDGGPPGTPDGGKSS
ncbi:MAG: hypothetical protein U0164_23385 [Gemmatimonadaceae bacterium]